MIGGYHQQILRIDLTTNQIWTESFSKDVLRKFIGGSGLAAKILAEETEPGINPLGPENRLIFMTGPFTGSRVFTSGRHAVAAKSPLTGIWGEADVGGHWGTELKKTGYDGIVFQGKAPDPVYIWIQDGKVEIRNAKHLWGKDTFYTAHAIAQETNLKANTACIGPAGELMVKYASIISDGLDARAAGRGGLGAVMGSKNLKAIAVFGSQKLPENAFSQKLIEINKSLAQMIISKTKGMHDHGTGGSLPSFEIAGGLPIKNWSKGSWERGAEKISGARMSDSILKRKFHCGSCIIGCGRVTEVCDGIYKAEEAGGPEYETLALLGSMCMVEELEAINYFNLLCNKLGMDTISTGGVIAFAMEAFENGIITLEDSDGLEISWGDPQVVIELIYKIAKREGIGKILSEGTRAAAEHFGRGSERYAIHVKGMELPAHDPRAWVSVGVAYATSNRGACHLQAFSQGWEKTVITPAFGYPRPLDRFTPQGKGELVAKTQNLMCMFDSLKLCKFSLFGGIDIDHIAAWVNAVTGWDYSIDELVETGERLFTLKRMYNVGCGVSAKDDVLPYRIEFEKRGEGNNPENLPPMQEMMRDYYAFRNWDKDGKPSLAKIKFLGLEEYVYLMDKNNMK